jgi:2-methylcitrate dehydratase PrpD
MNGLEALAEFVQSRDLAEQPAARIDHVKRHFVDTVGAMLAGSRASEGIAAGKLAGRRLATGKVDAAREYLESGVRAAVLVHCAAARATELDDIHLASCTTAGAVIVPTALALSAAGYLQSWPEFCAATIAGYELLIRLGLAIGGPAVLRRRVWPTYLAAAFGSAATATRAYGLNVGETAAALGTALALSVGTSIPSQSSKTARWLVLGVAAANGILAAAAARKGLLGAADFLESRANGFAGVRISRERLLGRLGTAYLLDDTGMKPYPIARQALAAVEACRELVRNERLKPAEIREIVVGVPESQRWLIDRPEPRGRMDSIASVQYQVAAAVLAPERLQPLRREPAAIDSRLRNWMRNVRVQRAADLEKYFPDAWPARVEIRARRRRFRYEMIFPRGDARNPFDWEDVSRKFLRYAQPSYSVSQSKRFLAQVRNLEIKARTPAWDFWPAVRG